MSGTAILGANNRFRQVRRSFGLIVTGFGTGSITLSYAFRLSAII
jgi:hypothetical protein